MKELLDFILYCLKCMVDFFSTSFGGRIPKGFGFKEGAIGFVTFLVIAVCILLILLKAGVLEIKKSKK